MGKLVLIRHGESEWNKKNLFTGWVDIPLSQEGVEESLDAGRAISEIPIDVIFTSTLIRAIMTAMLAMGVHKSKKVPVILHPGEGKLESWCRCHSPDAESDLIPTHKAWELNERMYGELQGMDKNQMRKIHGEDQVQIWRRSYDVPPPEGESLEMTAARTLPYFTKQIVPHLEKGGNVMVAAHGNSLRAIVMKLDNLSKQEVLKLEIKTGKPYVYQFEEGKFAKQ